VKSAAGTAAKVLISGSLIAILLWWGYRENVWSQLKSVSPQWVAIGAAMLFAGWLVNSVRWGLLLRASGVVENQLTLASLYFIGMFFSQILPTGAGGDAVRMWAVAHHRGKGAAVIVATLQERLVGMGVSCLLGLCVVPVYFYRLPHNSRLALLAIPAALIVASAGLYPRIPLAFGHRAWTSMGLDRWNAKPIVQRFAAALQQVAQLPPLTVGRLLPVLLVGLTGILLSIGEWWALGRAGGITESYAVYCLVVPLVWIVSMTPSVGGLGVREGGFAWLMSLFSVPPRLSLAVAALYLIVQTAMAGIGGLLLLGRIWTGTWKKQK
jgi:glycosyltransferase 2 family protein